MQFISYIGKQLMSIINPVITLREHYKVNRFVLFYTDETREEIIKIKDILKNFNCDNFIDLKINTDESSILINDVIEEDKDFIFNITGGLNFQLSQFVNTIKNDYLYNGLYCYSEDNAVHVYNLKNGSTKSFSIKEIPIKELIKIYDFSIKEEDYESRLPSPIYGKIKNFIKIIKKKDKIYNLKISLSNKKIIFHLVTNFNNTLTFFNFFDLQNINEEQLIDYIRMLKGFSQSKELSSRNFHKRTIIISSRKKIIERIKIEGMGKIEAYSENEFFEKLKKTKDNVEYNYQQIFNEKGEFNSNIILHIFLGKNLIPTLKAIYTIKPEVLNLYYTPEIHYLNFLKNNFYKNYTIIPTKKLNLIPVKFNLKLKTLKKEKNKTVIVNTTPGTKLQGFMLSLIGKINNYEVTTIDKNNIVFINSNKKIPVEPLNIENILKLYGFNFEKDYIKKIYAKRRLYEKSIEIIREYLNELIDFETLKEKLSYCANVKLGFLFEKIVAYRIYKNITNDIFINLKIKWADDYQEFLEEILNTNNIFLTEIDIISYFNNEIYGISCKFNSKIDLNSLIKDLLEISSSIKNFGTFAIPLYCNFGLTKKEIENLKNNNFLNIHNKTKDKLYLYDKHTGTMIFGLDVLMNDELLKQMFITAMEIKRTVKN